MLVQVFEVIFLQPAVEDQPQDLFGGTFVVIGQHRHLHRFALGIGRSNHQLPQLRMIGPR
jgi:hypothetical protein